MTATENPYTVDVIELGILTQLKIIHYYDGIILALYSDQNGNKYFEMWHDVLEQCYLYVYFRVDEDNLNKYFAGGITLLDCMKSAKDYYFKSDHKDDMFNYKISGFENLDKDKLPTDKSYL